MYKNSYTLKTLDGLITNTYILAIIVAIIFIVVSMLVANMIAYEGGKAPQDAKKRKVWFFVLGTFSTIVFFLWNFFHVSGLVKGAKAQDDFLMHNAIATGVTLVVYIIIGVIVSKLMKRSKYGTIFSK